MALKSSGFCAVLVGTYAGAMPSVLNVSAYLFTRIAEPAALRVALRDRALSAGLRGTIVLAEEGINLFLAGDPQSTRDFIEELRTHAAFAALTAQESWST